MKLGSFKYGIEFTVQSKYNKLYGMRAALMSTKRYGVPALFKTERLALAYAKKLKLKDPKPIQEKIAWRYMVRVVELYSGRLLVKNGKWYSAPKSTSEYNPQCTYKEVMSINERRRQVFIRLN